MIDAEADFVTLGELAVGTCVFVLLEMVCRTVSHRRHSASLDSASLPVLRRIAAPTSICATNRYATSGICVILLRTNEASKIAYKNYKKEERRERDGGEKRKTD